MNRRLLLVCCALLSREAWAEGTSKEALFQAITARDAVAVEAILNAEPALANARSNDSSVMEMALFSVSNEKFIPPQSNKVLKTILAHKPQLDMFERAAFGDVSALRRDLDADPSAVQVKNHFGWTALHMAAFAGNTANAALLLDRGADVYRRADNRFRTTPLIASILTGQLEMTKLLLDRGADVLDRQAKGFTAMHEAAFLGRTDILHALLDHGAEVNSRTDDGRTPLSEALRGQNVDAEAFLKSKGATADSTQDVTATPEATSDKAETVVVTYRFAPQNEVALRNVIQRHWEIVRRLQLVTGSHQLYRADDSFIEIFTWRDAAIPDAPPAEVSAIWTEMERLADKRGGKSGINFEEVRPVVSGK